MGTTSESLSASLQRLVNKFEADKAHYLSKAYPEAQVKIDFISPFFKALGWDVENEAGLLHHQRDVIVERGETEGRPDYNFRIGGQTKFFVEAKAPAEPLDAARHILQAKGYAWSTKQVFFVILTDFEEFRFYDASIKPDERKTDEGLLLEFRYTDYLKNAEKLWEFSKERVAAGSLEAMLPRDRRTKRLRIPVDKAFLEEMTAWRSDLARDVYKNNPELTARQLNEIVQRLLDRIVFVRIAEDRRIIEKRQLADAVDDWKARGGKFHIFEWLNDLFHRINEDFNGEIFKPHLSEQIRVDSEVLARIIEGLYPPKSPYRFDVIGVELLGSIYERYLGNTIRLTPKRVWVEEKPEVRKAGGVYYTPKYIVDYIVRYTVGKAIEGKTPKQIEKIRILDPACGSGSFLIGAFQYLIDYHTQWYMQHPEKEVRHAHPSLDFMREVHTDPDGGHRLSVYRKARILKNNLFGVDIDPQAVEITMMSLYLKALEGEKSQLPPKQSLLPELKYNIVCGNSLIGPDIYDQGTLFADDERERINAFDWYAVAPVYDRRVGEHLHGAPELEKKREGRKGPPLPMTIPQIMRAGGFDCVIANPPYIFITGIAETQKRYFADKYEGWDYRFDVYGLFIEKGIGLLRAEGLLGFITPHTLLNNDSFGKLRKMVLERTSLQSVIDIGPGVFEGARNETMILVTANQQPRAGHRYDFIRTSARGFLERRLQEVVKQATALQPPAYALSQSGSVSERRLLEKLAGFPQNYGEFFNINQGLRTGDNVKYLSARRTRALHRPAVGGKHVSRYWYESVVYVLYDPKRLDAPRDQRNFTSREKMIVQEVRNITLPRRIVAAYDERQRYCLQTTNTINWKSDGPYPFSMKYALGILNSKLLNWYFRKKYMSNNHIPSNQLAKLPILVPIGAGGAGKVHDRMVALVERMLELNKKKHSGKLAPSEMERVEREVASTDREIDELVYELYGITDEERKIIEGAP